MTTILEDIMESCREIKEIDILGTQKNTNPKATPNEVPLLSINSIKVSKIIRRAFVSGGSEILEPINHFLLQNSDRIDETVSYLFVDEKNNLYELRKHNGHQLKQLDEKTKEDYLSRVMKV